MENTPYGPAPLSAAPRVAGAALLLAASILLSRVLGYAREAILAWRVGAGAATDAFYAAFQIPDLLNYFLAGGALSIAFIPLYTRHLARGDAEQAERLFATVLGTLGAVAVVATVLLWVWAEPLVALQFPRFDPQTLALTLRLTRIVLPAQIFFLTGGILQATLLARGRFGAAAAAPLVYNAGIITGGLWLGPRLGVEGFAWGALVGAALGPFLAPLLDTRGRVRLRLRFAPADRVFLGYLAVAAPLMFGQSLLTVDEWYDRWFGALLAPGTVAQLGYARRLMQVPVAVMGQALGAAALPALARLWTEGRREELDRVLLRTLQAGIALALLAGAACFALAQPVVEIVYRRGAFTAEDAQRVATLLALFSCAVPAWVVQQIAARAFYARGDTWRPMLLGTAVALLAIPLYLSFSQRFGAPGLAAAGALGMSVNALATLLLARRLHGAPALGTLLGTALRSAAVALCAALAARAALGALAATGAPQAGLVAALRDASVGALAFAAIVVPGAWLLGDAALRDALRGLLRGVQRRITRRDSRA